MNGSLFVLLLLSGLFWSGSSLYREYFYINVGMSWPEAQNYCREWYTDLATADTMDDVNRLVNIVDAGYTGSVWIGLKRGTQKRWVWSSGENISSPYFNWASGEPNDNTYCGVIYDGLWRDNECTYGRYFSCYSESSNGYIMVQTPKTWNEAQSYCRQFYTDLPTIHNTEENNQLTNTVLSGYNIWIGLFLDSWEWSDKWSLPFRNWAVGLPSPIAGSGDCVSMSKTNGKWAHESCDLQRPFICYGDERRKQIVRLKLSCNGECALNDPSVQTAILNEINEKLKSMGLRSDSKISWTKVEGEEVFHQAIKPVLDSNEKCNVQ